MLKNLAFYVFVCLLVSGGLLVLLPYSSFTGGAYNLSSNDIAKINRSSEFEKYVPSQEFGSSPCLVRLDWQAASALFGCGQSVNAIDIKSSSPLKIARIGGTNHADIRGVSEQDKVLLQSFSQDEHNRPFLIEIARDVWVGASLCTRSNVDDDGQPHFCLYFDGSRAHSTGLEDERHQSTIAKAYRRGEKILKGLEVQD